MIKNAEEIKLHGWPATGATGLLCGMPADWDNSEGAEAEGL